MVATEPLAFAVLLRGARLAVGLTQQALADRAGLSVRGIADLERGVRRRPYLNTVERLADALSLTVEERTVFRCTSRPASTNSGQPYPSPPPPRAIPAGSSGPAQGRMLPIPLSSFIGREQEIAELRRLLRTSRLLTLTGTGGIGKMRLALQVAAAVTPRYADGVCFVELAALAHPNLVPQAVATALGIRERPGQLLNEVLAEALAAQHLLLVLDNCEHVVDSCAGLVATLLRHCPMLEVLTTSRVALNLMGETVWLVQALSVPAPDHPPTPASLGRSEAAQLFVARAQAVAPGFVLTEENAPAVAAVCQQLEGVPLALELAAAWLHMLAPDELLARLAHPLALLVGTVRELPARQQSVRATLDWSYQLLAEPERRLFAGLAAFAGGADLDAIEVVGADADTDGRSVLERLARLVTAGLVQRLPVDAHTSRFRLLEPVREYAGEQLLAQRREDETRRRHASYFRDYAVEARRHLLGPGQARWLDRLERDHENLRGAVHTAISQQNAALAAQLAASLWVFWYYRGHSSEGLSLLATALAMPPVPDGAPLRIAMHEGYALLALHAGDYPVARNQAEQGAALARIVGDRSQLAESLSVLGFVARVQEDARGTARVGREPGSRACDRQHVQRRHGTPPPRPAGSKQVAPVRVLVCWRPTIAPRSRLRA